MEGAESPSLSPCQSSCASPHVPPLVFPRVPPLIPSPLTSSLASVVVDGARVPTSYGRLFIEGGWHWCYRLGGMGIIGGRYLGADVAQVGNELGGWLSRVLGTKRGVRWLGFTQVWGMV